QSASGAQVYFVENRDLPMLDVSVEFPAGSRWDGNRPGLANMVRHLLPLGAGGRSEDEIARRLADVGAVLGGSFDRDRAGITLRTLSRQKEKEQSLAILADILQHPDFPPSVLEREKARMVDAIREEATQPESIADKAFYAAVYGQHPYAHPPEGDVDSVAALQRPEVVDFYQARYRVGNAVIAVVGDVGRSEAEAIANRLSGQLPSGKAETDTPPVGTPAPVERYIENPAQQSHILLGYPGVSRSDPDYFTLFVGNHVLGGGRFASRLMNQIREKRGLAYSVYSYFNPLQQAGPFTLGLQTKKDQTEQALALARKILADFVAQGPTAEELEKAKQNIVLGFPLRIDSNAKILGYLAMIGFYHLPLSYLDDFVPRVERVSIADVRAAFARHIKPEGMVTVVVGASAPVTRPNLAKEGKKEK
ncbi:MAG: insulinase family protein, partial [Sulfuricellaceae bacterium]|nr:insulinase family protein [Sulfuricellaceae bacterium]